MVRCGPLFRSIYGVYVYDERGGKHHRPHAHIKRRRTRIASLMLETGQLFDVVEPLPAGLYEELIESIDLFLDRWGELNGE